MPPTPTAVLSPNGDANVYQKDLQRFVRESTLMRRALAARIAGYVCAAIVLCCAVFVLTPSLPHLVVHGVTFTGISIDENPLGEFTYPQFNASIVLAVDVLSSYVIPYEVASMSFVVSYLDVPLGYASRAEPLRVKFGHNPARLSVNISSASLSGVSKIKVRSRNYYAA